MSDMWIAYENIGTRNSICNGLGTKTNTKHYHSVSVVANVYGSNRFSVVAIKTFLYRNTLESANLKT